MIKYLIARPDPERAERGFHMKMQINLKDRNRVWPDKLKT
jgi:hypothetical protein